MNIKYPLIMTRKKMIILLVAHWHLSTFWAMIQFALEIWKGYETARSFYFFTCLILDIIILISFVVTYSYFYLRVKKIRSLSNNEKQPSTANRNKFLLKKFKIPCYIMLTYICFNIVSTILMTCSGLVKNETLSKMFLDSADIPIVAGFTSDATIYILANKNVQKLICNALKRENRVSNVASTL